MTSRQRSWCLESALAILLFSNVGIICLAGSVLIAWERRLMPLLLVPVAALVASGAVAAIAMIAARLGVFRTRSVLITSAVYCVVLLLSLVISFPIGLVDINVIVLTIAGAGAAACVFCAAIRRQSLRLVPWVAAAYVLTAVNLTWWTSALSDATGGEAGIGIFTYAGLLSGLAYLLSPQPEGAASAESSGGH